MADLKLLDRFARANYGIVTYGELKYAGVPPRTISRWTAEGRLLRIHHGVYRVVGAPVCWEGRVLAAVLACGDGAAGSHRSAARLWDGYDGDEIDVTVPRGRTPRLLGVAVHRPLGSFTPSLRKGVPVTNPLRTLVDLGSVAADTVVKDAFNELRIAKLVTYAGVERECLGLARPGRRGVGALKRVLDAHALAMEQPDSRLEIRMYDLLRKAKLPMPRFQHRVCIGGSNYRIDFAYPAEMVAVEVDGFATRATPERMAADLERQNVLTAVGWKVHRFMWEHIVRRSTWVAQQVASALGGTSAAYGRIGAET